MYNILYIIFNFKEISIWSAFNKIIFESLWPFFGGKWLRNADVPTPKPLEPDKDAKLCPECVGVGKVKTGERKEYHYKQYTVWVTEKCYYCYGSGRVNREPIFERKYGERVTTLSRGKKCPKCNGKGGFQKKEKRYKKLDKPPKIVPIFEKCNYCRGFGSIGKHIERDAEILDIEGKKVLSILSALSYALYYSYNSTFFYNLTL